MSGIKCSRTFSVDVLGADAKDGQGSANKPFHLVHIFSDGVSSKSLAMISEVRCKPL